MRLCLRCAGAQTAERRVPINTASRYNVGALSRQNYFPFKVNGTGVMPVIFASSVIGVPPFLAKIAGADSNSGIVQQLQPSGALYLPLLVTLIVVINYFYTFIQFEPNDIAENLKKGVRIASIQQTVDRRGAACRLLCGSTWSATLSEFILRCAVVLLSCPGWYGLLQQWWRMWVMRTAAALARAEMLWWLCSNPPFRACVPARTRRSTSQTG